MILYDTKAKSIHTIDRNSYMFQTNIDFANNLLNNNIFFTEQDIVDLILTKFLDYNDSTFIDIGANVGAYTLSLAKHFNHTYSFEPDIDTYNIMCGNIAINGLSNVTTLINSGLSYKEDKMIMHRYDISGSLNHITESDSDIVNENMKKIGYNDYSSEIYVKTLDSYNIKNVGLIKIDVEGCELDILKGAKETISKYCPMLIIESWEINDADSAEMKEYKQKLRYDLFSYIKEMQYNIQNTNNPEVFICEYQPKTKQKVKTVFY